MMQVVLKALLAYLNPFSTKIVPCIKSVNLYFENGNNYFNVLILKKRIFITSDTHIGLLLLEASFNVFITVVIFRSDLKSSDLTKDKISS